MSNVIEVTIRQVDGHSVTYDDYKVEKIKGAVRVFCQYGEHDYVCVGNVLPIEYAEALSRLEHVRVVTLPKRK